jgi:hypothetical protein
MGMQQGLAFYPSLLLLRVFWIFNSSILCERIVHYATLDAFTYKHTIQLIKKQYTNHCK